MVKTILEETKELVKELIGNEYLYLDTAVTAKATPHTEAVKAWAVCVSPANDLYWMDADEEWHKVEESSLITASLYQRIRYIKAQYKSND